MKLIIQENLWKESSSLVASAKKAGFDVIEVKVIPFSGETEPKIPYGPKLAFGSTSLMKKAIREKWSPGVFHNDNFKCIAWWHRWRPFLLNDLMMYTSFKDLRGDWDGGCFVRPADDFKAFTGRVFRDTPEKSAVKQIEEWKHTILDTGKFRNMDDCEIKPNTLVVCSPLKKIKREWRYFIVGGEISSASLYKEDGKLCVQRADLANAYFVNRIIKIWKPHHSFVLDIAEVPGGELRIIEVNCLNASGFYGCDMDKVLSDLKKVTW